MTSRAQALTLLVHAVVVVAVLAAVTLLAWDGKVGEQATIGIIATILGLAGGSAGTLAVQSFLQAPPGTVQANVSETTASSATPPVQAVSSAPTVGGS